MSGRVAPVRGASRLVIHPQAPSPLWNLWTAVARFPHVAETSFAGLWTDLRGRVVV